MVVDAACRVWSTLAMPKHKKPLRWSHEKLVALMEAHNVNSTALGAAVNVTESTARSWSSGASAPRSEALARIADYFGVPMSHFMVRS